MSNENKRTQNDRENSPLPISIPQILLERAKSILTHMEQDTRTVELSRPTLSLVVRQALQIGMDIMQEELNQGKIPTYQTRKFSGDVGVIVVRLPQPLRRRLNNQISAIHVHSQGADRPPTRSTTLRTLISQGLQVLAQRWLDTDQGAPFSVYMEPIEIRNTQEESTLPKFLMNVEDVAKFLKKSPSWVYKSAKSGRLPVQRCGASIRFSQAEIKAYGTGTENV